MVRRAAKKRFRTRANLSRQGILRAALALIDAKGLSAFNMRELGIALQASPMSVYRHFRNKSKLIDAVADAIVARFAPIGVRGGWQAEARAMSLRVRASMLAHPELAFLIGHELRRSSVSLRVNTSIIERLRATGVPPHLLAETYWALSSYTTGYTLLEAQTHRHRADGGKARSQAERARKLAPLLRGVAGLSNSAKTKAANVLARPLNDRQFLFGLDCLIRGLEDRMGESAVRSKRKPR